MLTTLATASMGLVSQGLDLESSFSETLQGFGLSSQAARLIWLPLPMLLVLVAAVVGVLVTVWLSGTGYI